MRYLATILAFTLATAVFSQDFSGLARVDMAKSQVTDDGSDLLVVLDVRLQHFVLGTKGHAHPLIQDQQHFTFFNRRRPVRHDHDRPSIRLHRADRAVQRLGTVVVEVRVRLVQHHDHRISINARK